MSTPDEQATVQQRLNEQFDLAQQRSVLVQRANARMSTLKVEGWSRTHDVRVEVDHSGLIADIGFADSAPRSSPTSLSRSIKTAHDAALRALDSRIEEIADEELADDDELRASLKDSYRQTLAEGVEPDGET